MNKANIDSLSYTFVQRGLVNNERTIGECQAIHQKINKRSIRKSADCMLTVFASGYLSSVYFEIKQLAAKYLGERFNTQDLSSQRIWINLVCVLFFL